MLGYFDDQTATEDSFSPSGWYLTGDLGSLDADGYLTIKGRIKDVVIRGGHKIYPARIEELCLRHDAIRRAAAFPMADDRLGERVCLVIEVDAAAALEPQEVLHHLSKSGLSKFDMPEFFARVDGLPLLPSGKVHKQRLQELVAACEITTEPVRFRASEETVQRS